MATHRMVDRDSPSASAVTGSSHRAKQKSTLVALLAVSTIALILRYPSEHELGIDSFQVHGLANVIATTGSMNWLITPFSFFGLAPFSYSPAVPLSAAACAELAGVHMEIAILAYSLFLGAITPWTTFLLGRAATRHDGLSLLLSLLVTMSSGMVQFTDWTMSTRGAFLVFTPLAIALFIKTCSNGAPARHQLRALLLVLFTLTFIHALWLLLIPALVAVWLALKLATTEEAVLRRSLTSSRRSSVTLASCILVGGALLLLMELGPTQTRVLEGVPSFSIKGIPDNIVTGEALQLTSVMGLGVVLLPVGLYKLSRDPTASRRYLLASLSLVFVPISLDPVYGVLLALPVLLLMSAFALVPGRLNAVSEMRGRRTRLIAAGSLLAVLTLAIPPLVTIPRASGIACGQTWILDDQTYNAALYQRSLQQQNSTFAWDDGVEAERIEAISGVPAVEPLESIGTLEFPWLRRKFSPMFVTEQDLLSSIVKDHQLIASKEWLSAAELEYNYYWGKHTLELLQNPPQSAAASQILQFYNTEYAIQRCGSSRSSFFDGVDAGYYAIYADERQRTFLL